MSYIQKSYKGPSIWIGILVALVLLSRCATGLGGMAGGSTARLDTPEAVERSLFESGAATVYRTIKRTYPDEFKSLTTEIARRARGGESSQQLEVAIQNFMFAAEKRHRPEMFQANAAALANYRLAEIRVIEGLEKAGPRYCATFVTTGALRLPDSVTGPRLALADLHVATWEAFADGRDHPARRKVAQPSQADWALIDKAMLADGTDRETIDLFFDPVRNRQLTPEAQCAAGLSFRRAIEALPPGKLDAFYVAMAAANPS